MGWGSDIWGAVTGVGTSIGNVASNAYDASKDIAGDAYQGAKNLGTDIYEAGSNFFSGDDNINTTIGQYEKDGDGNTVNLLGMTDEVQNGSFSGEGTNIPNGFSPANQSDIYTPANQSDIEGAYPLINMNKERGFIPNYAKEAEPGRTGGFGEEYQGPFSQEYYEEQDKEEGLGNWPKKDIQGKITEHQDAVGTEEERLAKSKLSKKQQAGNFMQAFAEGLDTDTYKKNPYQYSGAAIFGSGINYKE